MSLSSRACRDSDSILPEPGGHPVGCPGGGQNRERADEEHYGEDNIQHNLVYARIIKMFGSRMAEHYANVNETAIGSTKG